MARERAIHIHELKASGLKQKLGSVLDGVNATTVETAEILLDIQQMSDLLASLQDLRTGQLVNFSTAFEDL